jgi:predicted transcriptional regulator
MNKLFIKIRGVKLMSREYDDVIPRIKELLEQGACEQTQISELLNVSLSTVSRHIREDKTLERMYTRNRARNAVVIANSNRYE